MEKNGLSISRKIRNRVRARADFACEYCGVSEHDAGGELTVDHYQPQAEGGGDDFENLIYACFRCNLYKSDFWAEDEPRLWNPRRAIFIENFWTAESGEIYGLTETASLTIDRLRLNRPALKEHRRRKFEQTARREISEQMQKVFDLIAQTEEQQRRLLEEQKKLLEEQQRLLEILLNSQSE